MQYSLFGQCEMALVSFSGGDLCSEFEKFAKIYTFEQYYENFKQESKLKKLCRRFKRKINYKQSFLLHFKQAFSPDIWFINGFNPHNEYILDFVNSQNYKSVFYSHEMSMVFDQVSAEYLHKIVTIPNQHISCSKASGASLSTLIGSEVKILYPFIDENQISRNTLESRERLRNRLGITDADFVWAMSGYMNSNKNPLLFVQLAEQLINDGKKVKFIWLGSALSGGLYYYINKYVGERGMTENILFTGDLKEEYYSYLNLIDGFVLTSLYDSFPLVMLEAAYLNKPIVASKSGGVIEFFDKYSRGYLTSNYSIDAYVDRMNLVMCAENGVDSEGNFDFGTSQARDVGQSLMNLFNAL